MDPLDVMINIEQVLPYFQPIISADKQLVVGYEVKVYLQNGNQTEPLDWFFFKITRFLLISVRILKHECFSLHWKAI